MFKIGNYAFDVEGRVIIISDDNTHDLYPIQITEKILSEFGFEQTEAPWKTGSMKFDDWHNGDFGLHPIGGCDEWQISFNNKMKISFVRYLHDLQNAYLENTGVELKYSMTL